MKYNPDSYEDRRHLAYRLINALRDSGFSQVPRKNRDGELVFFREIDKFLKIQVFTTVVEDSEGFICRDLGKDAIRVSAVYTDYQGKTKGICRQTRVNRVGVMADIVERMLERARKTWKEAKQVERCEKCGSPKFISKKGNLVCTAACWSGDKDVKAIRKYNKLAPSEQKQPSQKPAKPHQPAKKAYKDFSREEVNELFR